MATNEWLAVISLFVMILGLILSVIAVWIKLNIAVNENRTRIVDVEERQDRLELAIKDKAGSMELNQLRSDIDGRFSNLQIDIRGIREILDRDIRDLRNLLVAHIEGVSSKQK